jgi:hypothetical protein
MFSRIGRRLMKLIDVDVKDLRCHAEVKTIFRLSQQAKRQCNLDNLTDSVVATIAQLEPVKIVCGQNGVYEFFADWHFLDVLQKRKIRTTKAQLFSGLSKEELFQRAFYSEFACYLKAPERRVGLIQLEQLFDQFDKPSRYKLVKTKRRSSASRPLVEWLAQVDRSAIRNQEKQASKSKPKSPPLPIFGELMGQDYD